MPYYFSTIPTTLLAVSLCAWLGLEKGMFSGFISLFFCLDFFFISMFMFIFYPGPLVL